MRSWFRRTLSTLGPGFITGAADDDPAGIATYTQTGVSLGYRALWMSIFCVPFMIVVQEMCARIGIVTGRGLGANMKRRFAYPVVLLLVGMLFAANTLNLGADLGMMAAATQLIVPLPFSLLVVVMTLLTVTLQIFTSYPVYARYLKWLTLSLFAYILVVFVTDGIDWRAAVKGTFFPSGPWTSEGLMMFVAVLGTSISPYLFFWQTSEEVEEGGRDEEQIRRVSRQTYAVRLKRMRLDVKAGMILSNLVAWFIMLLGAAQLRAAGYTTIESASQIAEALVPLAGRFASGVFALATLGTGLLTVPILSAAGAYAICELLDIPEGLSKKWYQAQAFYGLIIVSTLLGLAMNFVGFNPVRALIYSSVVNALTAPLLLVAITILASDRKIMGKYANSPRRQAFAWMAVFVMTAAPLCWAYVAWTER